MIVSRAGERRQIDARKSGRLLAFEHHSKPLLSRAKFISRLAWHAAAAAGLIVVALSIGVAGYHFAAGFSWIDSILNASMILSGMGPIGDLPSAGAKLFASAYALFSGITFLAITGIVFAPVLHRLLHKLHLDETDQ